MGKKNDIIAGLKKFRLNLSKKIKIKGMILFGSYARGDYKKNSDIDLMIISENFKKIKFVKRSLGFYKLWPFDIPVDYICYTPEEFKKQKKMVSLVSTALKEGIEIN